MKGFDDRGSERKSFVSAIGPLFHVGHELLEAWEVVGSIKGKTGGGIPVPWIAKACFSGMRGGCSEVVLNGLGG